MRKKFLSLALAALLFISVSPMFTLGAFSGIIRILVEPTMVFNAVYTFRDGIAWVQRDGRVGFVDRYGEVVIPLQFDSASHFFCEGLARVGRRSGDDWIYGFINMDGELVIDYRFTHAECFHNGVAVVGIEGLRGVIDTSGQEFIPIMYTSLWISRYGVVIARERDWNEGGSWGALDLDGNVLIPFEYDSLWVREGGLLYARRGGWADGIAGIYNLAGEVVVPFEYNQIESFHEGLAAVTRDGMIGFVDETGELVIPMQEGSLGIRNDDPRGMHRWQHHGGFEDGFAVISKSLNAGFRWKNPNNMGLIDRNGNVVLPFAFDIISSFSEGLAVVGVAEVIIEDMDEGLWDWDVSYTYGVIDMYGNFVIPLVFEHIGDFRNGIASATKDGQHGFIDREGKFVFTHDFDWLAQFNSELFRARRDGQDGLIDREGNTIIPFEYWWINRFTDERAMASKGEGQTGLIYLDGTVIIPFEYNWINRHCDDLILARRGNWQSGQIDFIDNTGQVLFAMPEGTSLVSCMPRNIDQNGGIFWLRTGDRETGVRFGILQVGGEYEEPPEAAAEEAEETPEEEIEETSAPEDVSSRNFMWIVGIFAVFAVGFAITAIWASTSKK